MTHDTRWSQTMAWQWWTEGTCCEQLCNVQKNPTANQNALFLNVCFLNAKTECTLYVYLLSSFLKYTNALARKISKSLWPLSVYITRNDGWWQDYQHYYWGRCKLRDAGRGWPLAECFSFASVEKFAQTRKDPGRVNGSQQLSVSFPFAPRIPISLLLFSAFSRMEVLASSVSTKPEPTCFPTQKTWGSLSWSR